MRELSLGRQRAVTAAGGSAEGAPLALAAHHLVTHAAILGMTGSGKTGLSMVLVEEALRAQVPVLMIDIKGDLPNLLLTFPGLSPQEFEPWVDADAAARHGKTVGDVAAELAKRWSDGLAGWGIDAATVAGAARTMAPRVLTPGTTAGEPVHVLSSLETTEAGARLWSEDEEAAREAISAAISLLLRLVERDADPARSREHVVLSLLAERRQRAGLPSGLAELLADLGKPPVTTVGALAIDDFLPPRDRQALAQELNALLASPTFASWRQGASLDVGAWLAPVPSSDGGPPRTPAVILSVAHLDDAERMLVLGLVLEQLLSWVRGLSGTSELRALVLFDEVFGFLPPHPASPPTKRPLLALLKQARAFGVGVVVATQNPMDLDYKALSNAGIWFVGRLQTDADRERVVEGLAGSDAGAGGMDAAALGATLKSLPPRTFFVRDVHQAPPTFLLETRWTMAWMRGPMTRREIGRLVRGAGQAPARAGAVVDATPPAIAAPASAPPAAEASVEGAPPAAGATGAPAPPDGWRTFHGHAPDLPTSSWYYTPHLAVTVVAHVRDAKLGVALNQQHTFAAPLGGDGRPDLARIAEVVRAHLDAQPVPGARYLPLPQATFLKKTLQAAERAMRDHVYRGLQVAIDLHPDLGLVRAAEESREAFAARCAAEAARRVSSEQADVARRYAPKLAKLEQRLAAAHAAAAEADSAVASAPGAIGAAILGVVAGGRVGQRLQSQQAKAAARLEKARRDWAAADAALREVATARDAEIATLTHAAASAHTAIETRTLSPKKNDLEVTEIGIAWAAR